MSSVPSIDDTYDISSKGYQEIRIKGLGFALQWTFVDDSHIFISRHVDFMFVTLL